MPMVVEGFLETDVTGIDFAFVFVFVFLFVCVFVFDKYNVC